MVTRRALLKNTAVAGTAMAFLPRLLHAQSQGEVIKRAIPSSGEELPMVGLGSSATFSSMARSSETTALREGFGVTDAPLYSQYFSYLGQVFTGADILLTTCLTSAVRHEIHLTAVLRDYMRRTTSREAYRLAIAANRRS